MLIHHVSLSAFPAFFGLTRVPCHLLQIIRHCLNSPNQSQTILAKVEKKHPNLMNANLLHELPEQLTGECWAIVCDPSVMSDISAHAPLPEISTP